MVAPSWRGCFYPPAALTASRQSRLLRSPRTDAGTGTPRKRLIHPPVHGRCRPWRPPAALSSSTPSSPLPSGSSSSRSGGSTGGTGTPLTWLRSCGRSGTRRPRSSRSHGPAANGPGHRLRDGWAGVAGPGRVRRIRSAQQPCGGGKRLIPAQGGNPPVNRRPLRIGQSQQKRHARAHPHWRWPLVVVGQPIQRGTEYPGQRRRAVQSRPSLSTGHIVAPPVFPMGKFIDLPPRLDRAVGQEVFKFSTEVHGATAYPFSRGFPCFGVSYPPPVADT